MTDFNFQQTIILENQCVKLEPLQREHIKELWPIAEKYTYLLAYSPALFGNKALFEKYFEVTFETKANLNRCPFIFRPQ
jgi:hypothetical protein